MWPLVFGTSKPVNSPLQHSCEERQRIGKALAIPLLETIIDTLLTDPDVWFLGSDTHSMSWVARWVAEHLVLWLYGLEKQAGSWCTRKHDVMASHQQGRRLCNEFLHAVPYISIPKVGEELRDVFAPDGSIDMWTALYAFNEFRFRMCDAVDTFEASEHLDETYVDVCVAESTAVCESALILSCRLREHAALSVLVEAGRILQDSKLIPSAKTLMRRSLDTHRAQVPKGANSQRNNLVEVLVLARTVLSNMISFRALITRADDLQTISRLLRVQGVWTSARTLSFTAICCSDDQGLFRAVQAFEAAAAEETHCFMRLLNSNNVILAAMEDDLEEEEEGSKVAKKSTRTADTLRRSFVRLSLLLNSPRFEHTLWKGVDERDRLRVESLFDEAVGAAHTNSCEPFAAFHNIFCSWSTMFPGQNANSVLCQMLVDPDAHKMFQMLLKKSAVSQDLYFSSSSPVQGLSPQFKLCETWKNVQREGERRLKEVDDECSWKRQFFDTVQFTEADLGILVDEAKRRGWE